MQKKGNRYGTHRVIAPKGMLPQAATQVSNDMTLFSNEILCNVSALNVDSASFTQISQEAGGDHEKIKAKILEIVAQRGKLQNPVTGSGGMFIGTIAAIGEDLVGKIDLKVGDAIASLVSLSLTPLRIDEILGLQADIDRVDIRGQAILFETGIYAKLPDDMSNELALAALDVAGAPAQAAKLVKPGDHVLVVGGAGKSGMLCLYEAMKRVGPTGFVTAAVVDQEQADLVTSMGLCHAAVIADATQPAPFLEAVLAPTKGKEYTLAICCVNVQNCEMSCILPVENGGVVYFFSMSTSFTRATLGAEGVGKDVTMVMGNGYTSGHAAITLAVLRESAILRTYFQNKYL